MEKMTKDNPLLKTFDWSNAQKKVQGEKMKVSIRRFILRTTRDDMSKVGSYRHLFKVKVSIKNLKDNEKLFILREFGSGALILNIEGIKGGIEGARKLLDNNLWEG